MGKGLIKPKYIFCFNPLFPQLYHRAFQCLSNKQRYRFLPSIALASGQTPSKYYVTDPQLTLLTVYQITTPSPHFRHVKVSGENLTRFYQRSFFSLSLTYVWPCFIKKFDSIIDAGASIPFLLHPYRSMWALQSSQLTGGTSKTVSSLCSTT